MLDLLLDKAKVKMEFFKVDLLFGFRFVRLDGIILCKNWLDLGGWR